MSVENSTFKSRAAAAYASEPAEDQTVKKVDEETTENKAVKSASTKKKRPAPLKTVTRGR